MTTKCRTNGGKERRRRACSDSNCKFRKISIPLSLPLSLSLSLVLFQRRHYKCGRMLWRAPFARVLRMIHASLQGAPPRTKLLRNKTWHLQLLWSISQFRLYFPKLCFTLWETSQFTYELMFQLQTTVLS